MSMNRDGNVLWPEIPAWQANRERLADNYAQVAPLHPRDADEIDVLLRLAEVGITEAEQAIEDATEQAHGQLATVYVLRAARSDTRLTDS